MTMRSQYLQPWEKIRDKCPKYLAWLRERPCIISGATYAVVAHHEPPKGIGGGRSTDFDAVPLAHDLHMVRHGQANEAHPGQRREIIDACLAARLPLVQFYLTGGGE